MAIPREVSIVEVGPRDGFQMERAFIPSNVKVAVIDTIARAGITKIETTSFVSPHVVPQLQDAPEVMRGIARLPGVSYTALIPNLKGAARAVDARVDAMRIVVCCSEAYNRKNVGMSIQESLDTCRQVLEAGKASGIPVEVILGLCFGCPLQGDIPEDTVLGLTRRLVAMGYTELSIADSVGFGNPRQVRHLMGRLLDAIPDVNFSLHLHNTRGLGLANALAALEEGIDTFDASIGGLGGCPVVPGGAGNIPTEDLVNMLDEMDVQTGVDIDGLLSASRMMQEFLHRPLPSHILAAGTRRNGTKMPEASLQQ
jgi:hydroxymethylglutaryl-CoA lyase